LSFNLQLRIEATIASRIAKFAATGSRREKRRYRRKCNRAGLLVGNAFTNSPSKAEEYDEWED